MPKACYNENLISLGDALKSIHAHIQVINSTESLTISESLERILVQDCYAPFDLPPFTNAAMDGYAFASHDIKPQGFNLKQIGTSWAGHPFTGSLSRGECVRIFTGAPLPKGADSVIMQEQIEVTNNELINFPADTQARQHIRPRGQDAQQGDCLLTAPKKLTAVDIALLASAGLYQVKVNRKIQIAFFSTGDELKPVGSVLDSGQIYDSNRYLLKGLLDDPCYQVSDLGLIADDKYLLEKTLQDAATQYDVIISTGGASVGDADHMRDILMTIGHINFWKLAMKPGKPFLFGQIQSCYFFGLPGNPVSVLASFQQLVTPALQSLIGLAKQTPLQLKAICKSPLKKSAGRLEFQRGIVNQTQTGEFEVISAGQQGSNILTASSQANCYIILAAEQTDIHINQIVTVQPFSLFL